MKRIAGLFVAVLLSAVLLCAQEKGKETEMTGWICDAKCVKQVDGKATCDPDCKDKSGEAVLVDDQGKAWKVTNPAVCKGKMGKKVKVQCKKMEDQDAIWIRSIYG